MKVAKLMSLGFLMAALAAGCGDKAAPTGGGDKNKGGTADAGKPDAHPHGKGPNGGVVFDLGKDHAEFTVDHPAKSCTILFVTGDNKDAKPLPVAAKEFTLITKETKTKEGKVVPTMIITMKAVDEKDGKAAKFVGTNPELGNVADFEGTVTGEVGGKPAQGEFKE